MIFLHLVTDGSESSLLWGSLREVHSVTWRREEGGRRELEVTQMRWGGINSGESGLASNHRGSRRRRQKERPWENTWGDNSWKLP